MPGSAWPSTLMWGYCDERVGSESRAQALCDVMRPRCFRSPPASRVLQMKCHHWHFVKFGQASRSPHSHLWAPRVINTFRYIHRSVSKYKPFRNTGLGWGTSVCPPWRPELLTPFLFLGSRLQSSASQGVAYRPLASESIAETLKYSLINQIS